MKINQKVTAVLVIVFGVITMCLAILSLLRYFKTDITMIFAGLTQLCLGLNQISIGQNIALKEKGNGKNNKIVGIFSIIVGAIIIGVFLVEKIV